MRITRLDIDNFRRIKRFEIDLVAVNVLFGMNHQGKTSVLNALQWALFGRVPGLTDARGAGSAALIRDGAKSAQITVSVEMGEMRVTIIATINRRGANEWVALDTDTGEVLEDTNRNRIWSAADIYLPHAEVAAMPHAFLLSNSLSDVLAEFAARDLDPGVLQEYFDVHDGWLTDFVRREGLYANTAEDLAAIGRRAYEKRTELNRELKTAKSDLDTLQATGRPKDRKGRTLTVGDLPAVQERMGALAQRQRALVEERGAASNAPDPVAVAEAQDALPRLQAQVGELEPQEQQAGQAVQVAAQAHSDARHDLDRCRTNIEKLKRLGDQCPTCGQSVDIAPLLEDAERQATKHQAALDKALAAIQPARDAHKELAERLDEARRAAAKAEQLAAHKPTRSQHVIDEELDQVEAQLQNGRNIIDALEKLRLREETQQHVQYLEAQIERLTWAVKQFKDGEALKGLVGDRLGTFTARVNEQLEDGYEVTPAVSGKAIDLLLQSPDESEPRTLRHCSAGQQCMVAGAIALAFAERGGVVLLDDINHLDARRRRDLLLRLKDRDVGTALVACAWQQSDVDISGLQAALAPARVVWVEGE